MRSSRVDPNAVRTVELAGLFALAAPGSYVFRLRVVLVDPAQAVAVGNVDVAVGSYCYVGRLVLFFAFIRSAFAWVAQDPEPFAVECGFRNEVAFGIGEIQILAVAFLVEEQPVRSELEIFAPAPHEFAVVVEDGDGVLAAVVDDDPLLGIHHDAVSVAILAAAGEAAPIADEFVGVLATAEGRSFVAKQQGRAGSNSDGGLE